jgi:localization factor PodJL
MAADRSYWADREAILDMGFDEAEMRRKLSEVADWLRDQADDRPRPYLRAVTPDFEPPYRAPRETHILDELIQRRLAAQYRREEADARMRTVMDRFNGPVAPARPAPLRAAVAEIVERQRNLDGRHLDGARSYEAPSFDPPRDPIAKMEAAFERIATQFEQRLQQAAQQQQQPPQQPQPQQQPEPVAPEPQPVASQPPAAEQRDPVSDMEKALERLAVQFEQRTGQTFEAIDATLQEVRRVTQQAQAPVQAAEAAAAQVVQSHLQMMAKATHERIDTVARDLADLRADATDAERRMRDVMDTVRQTLEHIATRLPQAAAVQPAATAVAAAQASLSARARAAAKLAIEESAEIAPPDLAPRERTPVPERRRFIAAARRSVLPEEKPEPKAKYKAPAPSISGSIPAPASAAAQRLRITAADMAEPLPTRIQLKRFILSGAAAAALLLGIFAGSSSLLSGMFGDAETAQISPEAARIQAAQAPEAVSEDEEPPPPVVAKVPQLFAPKETVGPATDSFTPSEPAYTGSIADESPTLALPAEIGGENLRSAAAAGNADAQYEVGVRFAEGRGVAKDLQKAAMWLERSAKQGLPPAQYRYGHLAEKGEGMQKDVAIARRYYEQAATAGNVQAMHNLGVLYADGAFGKPDLAAAMNWFRKAADYGVKDSQYNLGIFYARGISVPKDPAQSYLWFSLAAAQGDKDAAAKRDQIGGKLDAAKAESMKAEAEAWQPKAAPMEANVVTPPSTGWDTATSRAGTKVPITRAQAQL